jgi:hypothetical protein
MIIKDAVDIKRTYSEMKEYSIKSLCFDKLINTEIFSEAANTYLKNKKLGKPYYTLAPFGSTENEMFWREEERRCKDGYKVGDMKIIGRMYFYLNYFIMMRTPKDVDNKRINVEKIKSFPSFLMIQYLWWNFKAIAHLGGEFIGVKSDGGEDICCVKTRGAGFSYMDACDDAYNFTFIPNSKSYVFAYMGEYLDGADGIMPKIQDSLDFLNESTKSILPNGKPTINSRWGLTRYDIGKEPKEFKSGFKDLGGKIHGNKSEVISVICDNANKARSKRGRKITIEEAGSFPALLTVLSTSKALVEDSGYKTGQIVMFGTGGESGAGIAGLEEIYYNPKGYGFMAFPNIFGDNPNDKVGFFCPSYLVNNKFKDKDGNPDVPSILASENLLRDSKKKVSSEAYDRHTAEYPHTSQEALKRLFNSDFPTIEINKRIQLLKTDRYLLDSLIYTDLELNKDNQVILVENKCNPILIYPHNKDEYNDGCIVIKQLPINVGTEAKPRTPNDIYFITVDNFGVDKVENKTSLFCCQVWKMYNKEDNTYARVPVAWYRGRPRKQSKAFYMLMMLSMYYGNAKIYGEYNAQGIILINWFKNKKKASLIAESDNAFSDRDSKIKTKWQKITTESKSTNIKQLAEYLLDERTYKLDDNYNESSDFNLYESISNDFDNISSAGSETIVNLDEIFDIVWLLEMLSYRGQNADTISCSSLAMPLLLDREYKLKQNLNRNTNEDLYLLDSFCD